eukprot:TRINITY_DN19603_c0_g1_i1.p1 TRINITY_DN19603_c0_g1~~TRINITY_DN19603_c0_g1_i1.p1  ORF type:complete len:275 (-),score=69.54 TRINITY_DN19603_c0_g1_i1:61-885(-)
MCIRNKYMGKGLEELLAKLVLLQREEQDKASVLARTYFHVSALSQHSVCYEEIDSYGAFVRVSMLELFDVLTEKIKEALLEHGWQEVEGGALKGQLDEKFGKYIVAIEGLVKVVLNIVNAFTTLSKEQTRTPMTYSYEYRKRLCMGQSACMLIKMFDHRIFTKHFRKTLCEVDPVQLVADELKAALNCSNVPILRNYFEVCVVKLATEFPEEVVKSLVLPMMCDVSLSIQIRSSAVFIGCALMDRLKSDRLQQEILNSLISYVCLLYTSPSPRD